MRTHPFTFRIGLVVAPLLAGVVPSGRDALRVRDTARAAGVRRIDHLVTTHWHPPASRVPDQYGGVGRLAQLMPTVAEVAPGGRRCEMRVGWEGRPQRFNSMPARG
jgi:glyoxylase-like metal-dependent hydrolase (beta-lactamase superfamily II)